MASPDTLNTGGRANPDSTQLKKRKRSVSPDVDHAIKTNGIASAAQDITLKILKSIQQSESYRSLLDHPLPLSRGRDSQTTKRRRTQSTASATETIRSRIENGSYGSLDQLLGDLSSLEEIAESRLDGQHPNTPEIEHIQAVRGMVQSEQQRHEQLEHQETHEDIQDSSHGRPALQLLSLRGQTDSGVRQLFTGLPKVSTDSSTEADTKQLPNGFDLIDSALLNVPVNRQEDTRTLGAVFSAFRGQKPLEPPRSVKVQGNHLRFIPHLSTIGSPNRQDYRTSSLGTGSWLSYAGNDTPHSKGDTSQRVSSANATNGIFRAAFSSFAPSVDHGASVITESDRSKMWFRSKMNKPAFDSGPLEVTATAKDHQSSEEGKPEEIELADDLDEIVQNYVSEADMEERDDTEALLEEISDLIQLLSSHQAIRDLNSTVISGAGADITTTEAHTYELLRTQLQLIINALPPHAVTKLDGDRVQALNISTSLLLRQREIVGTTQSDEYSNRKQRTVNQPNSTVNRPGAVMPGRPTYAPQTPAYGQQMQAYSQNASARAMYENRSAAVGYNTPRAGMPAQAPQYAQQQYRAQPAPYATPVGAMQQQTPGSRYNQPFVSRATQPGYQQRAQERAATWQRPASPPKPMVNGQTPQQYQPRLNSGSTTAGLQSNSAMHQRLLEQMKQQQQQTVSQQASAP